MPPFDGFVRELLRGSDREAALQADANRARAARTSDLSREEEILRPFSRPEGVFLGWTLAPGGAGTIPVRLPRRLVNERSMHVIGATGVGKTTWVTGCAAQDVATPGIVTVTLDYSGVLATNMAEIVIPWTALRLGVEDGAKLLEGLRVWAPWSGRKIPSLHLTAPGGSISRRAVALTDLFVATVGAGELGHRQESTFVPQVKLMMTTGVPFSLYPEVATHAPLRSALLLAAGDPELTGYYEHRYAADAREGVVYSVLSRMDRFLSDEITRLALFGPRPFDASAWLESGTTICNFGGGLRSHRVFWASVVQHAVLEAVLTRQTRRTSPRCVIRIDEVQQGLPSATQAEELDEGLSLMRSRRACLHIAHQHAGQLAGYPSLMSSLRANVGGTAAFRVPKESAEATSCVLPEGLPPGMEDRGLTEPQIREAWMRVLSSLPERTFLLKAPSLSVSSIAVRAPTLDLDALAREVPEGVRALARDGQDGFTPAELRRREETWRRVTTELAATQEPNVDALARFASTGDETRGTRRGRRVRDREAPP